MQILPFVSLVILCFLATSECRGGQSESGGSYSRSKSRSSSSENESGNWNSNKSGIDDETGGSFWSSGHVTSGSRSSAIKPRKWWRQLKKPRKDCRLIECTSCDDGLSECDVPGAIQIRKLKAIKQLSTTECQLGVNFGAEGTVLWVDEGCRAIFRVCFRTEQSPIRRFLGLLRILRKKDKKGIDWLTGNTCPTSGPETTPETTTTTTTTTTIATTSEATSTSCEGDKICIPDIPNGPGCPQGFSRNDAFTCADAMQMCCVLIPVSCPAPPQIPDDRYNAPIVSDDGLSATYTCVDPSKGEQELTCDPAVGTWGELTLIC